MRVYRLEDRDGEGPYRSPYTDLRQQMMDEHDNEWRGNEYQSTKHPSAGRDFLWFQAGVDYCGFASPGEVSRWFEGYLDGLLAEGYVIAEYEIDPAKVKHGRESDQLAFPLREAERIGEVEP